jgi:hypothetical protein
VTERSEIFDFPSAITQAVDQSQIEKISDRPWRKIRRPTFDRINMMDRIFSARKIMFIL